MNSFKWIYDSKVFDNINTYILIHLSQESRFMRLVTILLKKLQFTPNYSYSFCGLYD